MSWALPAVLVALGPVAVRMWMARVVARRDAKTRAIIASRDDATRVTIA